MSNKHFENSVSSQIVVNVMDIALLCVCGFLALTVSRHFGHPGMTFSLTQRHLAVYILCYIPIAVLFAPIALRRVSSTDRIAGNTFHTSTLHFIVFLSVIGLLRMAYLPYVFLLTLYLASFILLFLERLTIYTYVSSRRKRGANQARVILVGNGAEMRELYHDLKEQTCGLTVEGLFAMPSNEEMPQDVILRGEPAHTLDYLRENGQHTDAVYCSMASLTQTESQELYAFCESHHIHFYMVPVFASLTRRHMVLSQIGSSFVLSPREEPLSKMGYRFIKRITDIIVSGIVLLTLFPILYTIIAIIIKCKSPGPVLSRQKRCGLNGEAFHCLLFRTVHLHPGGDDMPGAESGVHHFPFGEWLCTSHISKLPLFINVLFGDLSLVGPRPHLPAHAEEYSRIADQYLVRHWAKPGITGWEQIQSFRPERRYDDPLENRVHADIWYMENWSFWLDIRILMSTLFHVLFHRDKGM